MEKTDKAAAPVVVERVETEKPKPPAADPAANSLLPTVAAIGAGVIGAVAVIDGLGDVVELATGVLASVADAEGLDALSNAAGTVGEVVSAIGAIAGGG